MTLDEAKANQLRLAGYNGVPEAYALWWMDQARGGAGDEAAFVTVISAIGGYPASTAMLQQWKVDSATVPEWQAAAAQAGQA